MAIFPMQGNNKYLDVTKDLDKVKNLKSASIVVKFRTNNSIDVMTLFSASQSTNTSKKLALLINAGVINGYISGDTNTINIKSSNKFSDGNWHIAIMTLDSSGIIIYVDGKKVAESNIAMNFTSIASLDSINIARNFNNKVGDGFYKGNIAYLDIFNRILNENEVLRLSDMSVKIGYFNIPFIDLSSKVDKQITVDKEAGVYLGHPSTVLLDDNKTMYVVYPKGHGAGPIIMKKSTDAGITWSNRLITPTSWATSEETPILYKIKKPDGTIRIQMISGVTKSAAGGFRTAYSDDLGKTWSQLIHRFPLGKYQGIVAHASLTQLKKIDGSWDNKWMGIFHDGSFNNWKTYLSFDDTGKEVWTEPVRLLEPYNIIEKSAQLCEIEVLRSPDGNQLALIARCQAKRHNSMIAFSNDEGNTWTEPRELQGSLMGERHKATYDPISGRLLICFREIIRDPSRSGDIYNWVAGDWVGWVGTYDDLVRNKEGQYRVRFIEDFTPSVKSGDCGYTGNMVTSDGTFILTSYGYWETNYDKPYIKTIRLKLSELDTLSLTIDKPVDKFEFSKGFSNQQGNNGWYYKEFVNGIYKDMNYNSSINNGIWQGSNEWCRIYGPSMLHPGPTQDTVLAFKCPKAGQINITGNIKKDNINGGDGVRANIKYNNAVLWPKDSEWQAIKFNDSIGVNQNIIVQVEKDSYIYFTLNNNGSGNIAQDNTFWNPVITYMGETPLFKEVTVFSTEKDLYPITRIPGIVVASNGILIAYCEGRSSGSDWSTMDLVIKRSTDGGETWSNPIVLFNGIKTGKTYNNPVMIADKDSGLIHLVHCIGYATAYYVKSLDYGVTWSTPINITSTFNAFKPEYNWVVIATGPGHGIQLKNGRLLIPVWLSTSTAHSPSVVSTIYSDDNGATWKRGAIIQAQSYMPNPNETTAVELIDGSVLLNIRSKSTEKKRAIAISKDGVSNWSIPQLSVDLDDAVCFGSMIRLTRQDEYYNNRILFSNINNTAGRSNITIKMSMDEGKSWGNTETIYTGTAAYSDLAVSPDKKAIYCLYEKDGYNKLVLAKFNLEWLTNGNQSLNPLTAPNKIIYPATNSIVLNENWNSLDRWRVVGTGKVTITSSSTLNMFSNDGKNTSIINADINIRTKYTIEFKVKFKDFVAGTLGDNVTFGVKVCDGKYRLMLDFKANGVYAITNTGNWTGIKNISINKEWNIWKIDVDNGNATLYMNNQLLAKFTLALRESNDLIEHWINGLPTDSAEIEEDYFNFSC